MSVFLTNSEQERLELYPNDISTDDIIAYFTLSDVDMAQLPEKSARYNRLGFAIQLCTLRFLGFCPKDLNTVPTLVLDYLVGQINVRSEEIKKYGKREQTRTDHLQKIESYLGFKRATPATIEDLSKWLTDRALEHDKPTLLLKMLFEKLYSDKIIRPGITILEKIVVSARQKAQEKIYENLGSLLTTERKFFLDNILEPDAERGWTPLFRLRFGAVANTPSEILQSIEKFEYIREQQVEQWDLSLINPNRLKFLAQVGRKSSNQALQRAVPEKRYPALICFLKRTHEEIIDEIIELFDRCLGDCHTRSKQDLKKFHLAITKKINEKIIILKGIGNIILNSDISNKEIRGHIYKIFPENEFRVVIEECDQVIRPKEDHLYDFFGNRFSYIRQFSPKFLEAISFKSNKHNDSLLQAIDTLREINIAGTRKVPEDAQTDFFHNSWIPYVMKNETGEIVRRYYEIGTLWHLREALRSGDIWVENSRRYADIESYLIPEKQWPTMKKEACQILGLPVNGEEMLEKHKKELKGLFNELDQKIIKKDGVRVEDDELIVSRLKAEELPASVSELQNLISQRLPRVDLTSLLIEVDSWTNFTEDFEHALKKYPKTPDLLTNLYATILAPANNYGLKKMAEISGLSYPQLAWCNNWYIREETLQAAINGLVNYQFHQPLSSHWGGGTMSSSDGQRFPVAVKARNTTIIPKYYGYGRILTFYSWTSDQLSQWKCKPTPSMIRDATYVLDGMLDNETELPLFEHTTDTAGYTDLIFAFFDLLGFMFSPRIKALKDKNIYRIEKEGEYKNLNLILKGTINQKPILEHWDTFLRIMASLKFGWVTASLFISKLQAHPRKSRLTKALQEYGKLIKSIYIPKYICREDQQRRVSLQLNKGEGLHDLRKWLLFAEQGQIKKSQLQDQVNQASALTLVTNAVIVWNTRYMQEIIDQLRFEGYEVDDKYIAHISPCRYDHINKHGKLTFNVAKELNRKGLRAIRENKNINNK